jgi:hypothetical protein
MRRARGQLTQTHINRDWPEQVEFAPEPGEYSRQFAGDLLREMGKFCAALDHQTDSVRNSEGHFLNRWCFKTAVEADAFHAMFGGRRLTVRPRRVRREGGVRNWKAGWAP